MFQIQMGYPGIIQNDASAYRHLEDVCPDLFDNDEAFYVLWQDIPICFRYRDHLTHNFAAILDMLQVLKENSEGSTELALTNEILNLTISMHWQAELLQLFLHVETRYSSYQKYTAALNQQGELKLTKSRFMAEWHTLIHQLVLAFHAGKVRIEGGREQQRLIQLHSLDQQLEGFGYMYMEIINERYPIR